MKIQTVHHFSSLNTRIDNQNSMIDKQYTSKKPSFGAIKPKTAKSVSLKLFEKIRKFNLSKFISSIRQKREIAQFKSYLKYDKDFPKNKIESVIKNANIEDIRAKRTFYSAAKYSDFLPSGIVNETTIEIMSKVNKKNLSLAKKLYADPYFPKGKITAVIQDTDPESFRFKETFFNGLKARCELFDDYSVMKNHKNDLAYLMQQTDKEYLKFAGQLWNDPAFTKSQVLSLLHNDKEEIDALRMIYNLASKRQYNWGTFKEPKIIDHMGARMPAEFSEDAKERVDIIRNLLFYTTKDNVKTAQELCNLSKLDAEMVKTALKTGLKKA